MATTNITTDTVPTEWKGIARRVTVTTGAGTFNGWELTEDIEGYASAGQLWLDGEDESTEPAGDWEIEVAARYEILSLDAGIWRNDIVGDPNEFATEADAEAAIEELRKLGEDWAAAEYKVSEVH